MSACVLLITHKYKTFDTESARNHKIDELLETGSLQNQLKKSKRLNIIFSQIQGNVSIVLIRHF